MSKELDTPGIEPGAFRLQSATTALCAQQNTNPNAYFTTPLFPTHAHIYQLQAANLGNMMRLCLHTRKHRARHCYGLLWMAVTYNDVVPTTSKRILITTNLFTTDTCKSVGQLMRSYLCQNERHVISAVLQAHYV